MLEPQVALTVRSFDRVQISFLENILGRFGAVTQPVTREHVHKGLASSENVGVCPCFSVRTGRDPMLSFVRVRALSIFHGGRPASLAGESFLAASVQLLLWLGSANPQ